MYSTIKFLLTSFTLVQAKLDWNKVFPNELKVPHINLDYHDITHLKIVGGIETEPHSKPYQVALLIPVPRGTSFCGGSLISKRTVLTAAHCLDRVNGKVTVILGGHNIRKKEPSQIRVKSSTVIIHPDWNRFLLRNDVGLVILPSEVELNDDIQTIPLPHENSKASFKGKNALATGWGRYSDYNKNISPVLREVNIPIISNFWCGVHYLGSITDSHICASGTGGRATCNGDSGGPLVVHGVQVGIVSFGVIFGCEIGWPVVFSRITYFSDWIHENMIDGE
ncbi:brachyurin [Diabrotica virgifera virgifera]|nr:brachyurin [Diabrotica virgifera virgifera]